MPEQEWLDEYNVDKSGSVRQFIAAPLGKGYTVEEQITGSTSIGGIQVQAYPKGKSMVLIKVRKRRKMAQESIVQALLLPWRSRHLSKWV